MKKLMTLVVVMLVTSLFVASVAFAGPPDGKAGKSGVVQVDLMPVNIDDGIDDAATGRFTYNTNNGKFVFNGRNLTPGATYELRSGGPFVPAITAVANKGGNVHFSGKDTAFPGAAINLWNVDEDPDVRVARAELPE